MSRPRALLALVLAFTWCSAIAHAPLEALGWMPEHEHYAPDAGIGCHDAPGDCPAGHEDVFAQNIAKDGPIRVLVVATDAGLEFAPPLPAVVLATREIHVEKLSVHGQCDPPGVSRWRFEQRCALDTAAPPSVG